MKFTSRSVKKSHLKLDLYFSIYLKRLIKCGTRVCSFKLKQNGIDGLLLSLLTSNLTNRKQRVVLNGTSSDEEVIESGVSQGTVLGPLLFLIYINDLEQGIKSSMIFFADVTLLYSIVHDKLLSASELNHDLELIKDLFRTH